MGRLFRWLAIGACALLLLAIIAVAVGYVLLSNTVAPNEGKAVAGGLSAPVNIVRDLHGIAHVEAAIHDDAVMALGWLHASERMWQMEVLRMAAQGRLSEMFGAETISSDRFLKTLDIAGPSRKSVAGLTAKTKRLLEAYAKGVNAWINRETGVFEPSLPIEFIVLGHEPDPWEPWHSVAVIKMMALTLDANMRREIGRLALAGRGFDAAQIGDIYPIGPRDTPPPLPDLRKLYGFGENGKDRIAAILPANPPSATAPWTLELPASNNWAISGRRTETGKPLLANDPHLEFTAPSAFYLAHLSFGQSGEGNGKHKIIGGTLAGTPAILVGHNTKTAWGMTTTYLDAQDLFIERINPANENEYRTQGGYLPFETSRQIIKVKGGEDIAFTRRVTRHGPVLPDGYKKLAERLPDGHVAALSWTVLAEDDTTMDAIIDIAFSANVEDFIDRVRPVISPMQSIALADTEGNIGLIAPARVPRRHSSNHIAGRAPVPGWDETYDWQGYLDFEETPRIVNPAAGAVATANANWLPDSFNGLITLDFEEHFRQDRVEQLYVRDNRTHSMATMAEGQTDMVSQAMLQLRDEGLARLSEAASIDGEVLAALTKWDGRMDKDRPEPLIMTAWHRHLQEAIFADDLEDDYELFVRSHAGRVLNAIRASGGYDWCDDQATEARETCGDRLSVSLQSALAEITAKQGADWRDWRWGQASIIHHKHRPFSEVPMLAPWFTISQEMSGGHYVLWRNSNDFGDKDRPYAGIHGSAFRGIFDMSDTDNSRFIISTGQSGNVMSPHYDDLAEKWARAEYLPMVTSRDKYRNGDEKEFILEPQ